MRPTAWMASLVCSVESTRWPVSAAVSAVAMVSASRISPTRITSGVWRMMLRSVTGEIGRIAAHFDLLDDGAAVGVLVLDRVFDGHHVRRAAGVDEVDERGQGGGLAAAGGAGHQHQPLPALGQFGERGRQVQRFERRNARGQQPDAGRQRAALVMDVDAEAAEAFAHEAQVHRLLLLQLLQLPRLEQRQHQAAHVVGFERRARRRRPARR